jgi:hypothetical protein
VTILERSEGSTEVLVVVLRSIQVGKVTEDAMALRVPKSARITSEASSGPVKIEE